MPRRGWQAPVVRIRLKAALKQTRSTAAAARRMTPDKWRKPTLYWPALWRRTLQSEHATLQRSKHAEDCEGSLALRTPKQYLQDSEVPSPAPAQASTPSAAPMFLAARPARAGAWRYGVMPRPQQRRQMRPALLLSSPARALRPLRRRAPGGQRRLRQRSALGGSLQHRGPH